MGKVILVINQGKLCSHGANYRPETPTVELRRSMMVLPVLAGTSMSEPLSHPRDATFKAMLYALLNLKGYGTRITVRCYGKEPEGLIMAFPLQAEIFAEAEPGVVVVPLTQQRGIRGEMFRYPEDFTGEGHDVMFKHTHDPEKVAFYEKWTQQENWDKLFQELIAKSESRIQQAA